MAGKPRVLVVDDSAVIRQVLSRIIEADPDLELLGVAGDPILARRRMEKTWPDVIVLDVEMPRMDGLTFLREIMAEHPTPVVMCSTLTQHGADTTMQALAAGAVEAIGKPKVDPRGGLQEASAPFLAAVKAAAGAQVKRQAGPAAARSAVPSTPAPATRQQAGTGRILALGASTGGTNALETVLSALPATAPGLVIVQHMPAGFTTAFAARLDRASALEVREAADGDQVRPGRALIAPGDRHMRIKRRGPGYQVTVGDGPLVSRHRPSVDVLFQSVAKEARDQAMGVIMTGMGDDGVNGLDEMRRAGAPTLAQDEATCVVYGMPREAVNRGAAVETVPLTGIPERLLAFAMANGSRTTT